MKTDQMSVICGGCLCGSVRYEATGRPYNVTHVEDVDAAFGKAVAAGAQVKMPLADMFWGDRYGVLTDPFGHAWSLASHKEDLTPEQIGKRAQAACSEAHA